MRGATTGTGIAAALRDSRRRTLALVEDLDDEQLIGPMLPIVNPLLWEIGHIAWFQEKWVLRHLRGNAPVRADGDRLYDSNAIPHDTRWELPLPSREGTLRYMNTVLDPILDALERRGNEELPEKEAYFHKLALFHEDMHDEAFAYTRQTLEYPAPRFGSAGADDDPESETLEGDVEIPGGVLMLGATRDEPFVFDNEKWAHPVEVAPFRMARTAVTQAEYRRFVEDRGYSRRELWSDAGWSWRSGVDAGHPVYWRRGAGDLWERRGFDRWLKLEEALPVLHVNWYEADAFCRWAGRRLPTESEWELAATSGLEGREGRTYPWGAAAIDTTRANLDGAAGGTVHVGSRPAGDTPEGCRQMIGNVWEWTLDDFGPFPGFDVDPYAEYSKPWFGTRKVLRGGCWATCSRLIRSTYRNFYEPDRRDVWAGFRTCAPD